MPDEDHAPDDGQAPFTEASRARVELSAQMAELSDRAAAHVQIHYKLGADGSSPWATVQIQEIDSLAGAARAALTQAVVTARLGGATWAEVGQALDVAPQTAQERFGGDVARFRDELLAPENPHYRGGFGDLRYRLAGAAREPAEAAAGLDDWLRRRQVAGGEMSDPVPVSGGLARMDPQAELRWISDRSHRLWAEAENNGTGVPPLAARLRLAERTVSCWERIAAGQKRTSRTVRDALTVSRRNLAELRDAGAAPAPGEPR